MGKTERCQTTRGLLGQGREFQFQPKKNEKVERKLEALRQGPAMVCTVEQFRLLCRGCTTVAGRAEAGLSPRWEELVVLPGWRWGRCRQGDALEMKPGGEARRPRTEGSEARPDAERLQLPPLGFQAGQAAGRWG